MSFFGSTNGFLTTVASRSPADVATVSVVPSFARRIGTHAYAMFFLSRGE